MSKKRLVAGLTACFGMFIILMIMKPGQETVNTEIFNKYHVLYGMAALFFGIFVGKCAGRFKMIAILVKDILCNYQLIFNLAKNDFKMRYVSSNLGAIWNFIQPIVTVSIYVFVFQWGFKSVPVSGVPYVLWLVAGIIPWFFFSDAVMNGTNSLIEYTYLVKKVVFKIDILPMVKIVSNIFVHIFFIVIGIFMYLVNGQLLSLHLIQVVYYSFCVIVLSVGISYFTSAVVIFFRDLSQIVNIILQFGMWLTPIMWQIDMFNSKTLEKIMKLNPMYYITDGYRDAFYNKIWFWEKSGQTLYFWLITIIVFIGGTIVYKKLEKHFADVL